MQRTRGMRSLSSTKNHSCVAQLGNQGLLRVDRVETTEINRNTQAKKLELHLLSYEESLGDLMFGASCLVLGAWSDVIRFPIWKDSGEAQ